MATKSIEQFSLKAFKIILPLILLFCLVLNLGLGSLTPVKAKDGDKEFLLTIIHTNDIHAHDEPYLYKGKMVGGLARLGHIVRDLRAKALEQEKNVIVADAGDVFQGSTLYSHYHGEVEINLMNMIGYDIFTLGNHEFDDGASNLAKQLARAKFDLINCNLDMTPVKRLNDLVKPYVVKKFADDKVAFIGAITPQMELLSGGLEGAKLKAKGENWTDPIKKQVAELKQKGFDKIILVTHCGVDEDRELAEAVPDIDAIIGGHSHTMLDKRIVIKHDNGDSTTIVQTGCYSRYVGQLDLAFDDRGRVNTKSSFYRLHPVSEKTTADSDIQEYVATMVKPLLHLRHDIVGFATEDFGNKVRRSDSAIGNLVCDAIYELGSEYGVEITMHNRGGIRGNLEKGPISVETVEQILPFDNFAVFSSIKGSHVKAVLEHSLGGAIGGKFMDVRGLKVAYDPEKPRGERVVFVQCQDKSGKWSPLDPDRWYKFGINSYNFAGGEGYDFKGAKDIVNTKLRISQVLQKYLKNHNKVYPQKPNRLVAIQSDLLKAKTQDKISLTGVAPGARLAVVAGSAPGVSTIYNAFPVPLSNASVVGKSLKADSEGRFDWPYKKTELNKVLSRIRGKEGKKDLWLCVVAHPPRGDRRAQTRTLISNPVNLTVH